MRRHRTNRSCHATPFLCHLCGSILRSRRQLQRHIIHHEENKEQDISLDTRNELSNIIPNDPEEIPDRLEMPEDIIPEIRNNWSSIRSHFYRGPLRIFVNVRWRNDQPPQWDLLHHIQDNLGTSFKINMSNSFILQHITDRTTRYFHSSNNNHAFFTNPRFVENRRDLENIIEEINNFDHAGYAIKNRESTKWKLLGIVATSIYIYPIVNHPIGCANISNIPSYIQNNPAIYTLIGFKDRLYTDNMCLYRALALAQGATLDNLESKVVELTSGIDRSRFKGVNLELLNKIEKKYQININVYSFAIKHNMHPPPLILLRPSREKYNDTLNLLYVQGHFMFIRNLHGASGSFKCVHCDRLFKFNSRMREHADKCKGAGQIYHYPGGAYRPTDTILEILHNIGYDIDPNYIYPYRCCWDFEVILDKSKAKSIGSKTQIQNVHIPLSCSVHSNVPGFASVVSFVNRESPQELVNEVIDYLHSISAKAYQLLSRREPFTTILDDLEEKLGIEQKITNFEHIHKKLVEYLQELPVIGFNSGKYDYNLIKPYISRKLCFEDTENSIKFISKDNNNFKVISTEKLKFLDITRYLAAGTSYDKYLKAFGIANSKLTFPYEFLDHPDKLDHPELPPYEDFFSSLKNKNITREQYEECQRLWTDQNMQTLEDFLVCYNNRDVEPFLEALDKQVVFYRELGLDMFKDSIGIPGLTLRYLFKSLPEGVFFSLCRKKQAYLHDLYRKFLTGGPSLIFHRYHEANKTFIRGGNVSVKTVEGWDANSLYLHCLSLEMPTDIPTIYKKENNFAAEHGDYFGKRALEWLDYISFNDKITIVHKFNNKEKRFGRVSVDGWDEKNKTAYNFHGCTWHGHLDNCPITSKYPDQINPVSKKSFIALNKNTQKINKYLREIIKIRVIEIYECQWDHLKKCNKQIKKFLQKKNKNTFRKKTLKGLSVQQICNLVQKEAIFGVVQCDIEVPEELREEFAEFPPIFKNVDISRKDIGEHMLKFAEDRNLLSQPRRSMISSFFGKEILLATPLLKYYLQKDLRVTDIQLVVQYRPSRCFKKFQEKVSNDRREGARVVREAQSLGDGAPNTCRADSSKLMGNSAYGKTLSNKVNYTDVEYIENIEEAQALIREWNFKKITELETFDDLDEAEDMLYEVETIKKRVAWDLPIQIGFFVYNYAKLCMLRFYFDCLCYYIEKNQFQLTEMDTDSFYFALGSDSLELAVKPEKKVEFLQNYKFWFPSPCCDEHYDKWFQMSLEKKDFRATRDQCCVERENYEKFTPGLFKLEYKGHGIIALGSKTYLCFGGAAYGYNEDPKIRCKGLKSSQNNITADTFKDVLHTRNPQGGTNHSFKLMDSKIYTYSQYRDSISYLYIKRKVEDDGVTTTPLNL